ncbi:hypothetical protein RhiirA1_428670 [Rhizophagus irregularis]|uniref:Uncharacterized protein n=1 Tax=Rhizophagus irregularis TaxID=588596 RepID=A0A2N0R1L0_9GLOM|nr:hypothetical protein RhiirA1_428670 [Rhizophagus irregularis]
MRHNVRGGDTTQLCVFSSKIVSSGSGEITWCKNTKVKTVTFIGKIKESFCAGISLCDFVST